MYVIEIPFLDLEQVYNTNQGLRWVKMLDNNFIIPFRDQALKVLQNKERFVMHCTDEQFYDIWFHYFDLQTDYSMHNFKIKSANKHEPYFRVCANRGKGIRLLNQDLFEVIILSIVSNNEPINNARLLTNKFINALGEKHTKKIKSTGNIIWYEFPSYFTILENQDKLNILGNEQKAQEIISICQDIHDEWLSLNMLESMETKHAKEYLQDLSSINESAINHIITLGLRRNTFPVDNQMQHILEEQLGCNDYDMFNEWYLKEMNIGGLEGYLHQLMCYNYNNPPKGV